MAAGVMRTDAVRLVPRVALGLALCGVTGCDAPFGHGDPPLRPLLYTEAPTGTDGSGQHVDPVAWPSEFATRAMTPGAADRATGPAATPEQALYGVFAALVAHDEDALDAYLFDGAGLGAAARLGDDAARRDAGEIADAVRRLLATFDPGPASRARDGGLAALLRPTQVVVGRPRTIEGRAIEDPDDGIASMHWGNELTFEVAGTDARFTLRFPRLLRGVDGSWRLGAAPVVDARFVAFRALGIDHKPELLTTDHADLPLTVGNFWHYRTRRPHDGASEDGWGVLTQDGYRDEVSEVVEYDGYRVATMRRLFDNPLRTGETWSVLVTPTRVYRCDRECRRNAGTLSWVLTFASRAVPMVVFPLEPGAAWGAGGSDGRSNVFRVQPEFAVSDVPAGVFDEAYEIVRTTPNGREIRYFVRGVGFVATRNDAGFATTLEELTEYRVLR